MNQHMQAIATSSSEQATGLAEVNNAVNSMDQTTQQNAAMVEESTAAAASLASEAERLRELVGRFVLHGTTASAATALRQTAAVMAAKPRSTPLRSFAQPAPSRAAVAGGSWEEF